VFLVNCYVGVSVHVLCCENSRLFQEVVGATCVVVGRCPVV